MEPFSEENLSHQIRHLKDVERLSSNQIAKHLNVGNHYVLRILTEETSSFLLFRIRIEYLGQVYQDNTVPISGWHRDIEIGGDVSLNHLNEVIQEALGWDNTHLYAFDVNDKHYAYLGDDDYIVNDVYYKYFSAKICLGALGLHKGHTFVYKYDFGDRHLFPLTVVGIEKAKNSTDSARVIGFAGCDLIQYKTEEEEDEGQVFVSECAAKVDFKRVSSFQKG